MFSELKGPGNMVGKKMEWYCIAIMNRNQIRMRTKMKMILKRMHLKILIRKGRTGGHKMDIDIRRDGLLVIRAEGKITKSRGKTLTFLLFINANISPSYESNVKTLYCECKSFM